MKPASPARSLAASSALGALVGVAVWVAACALLRTQSGVFALAVGVGAGIGASRAGTTRALSRGAAAAATALVASALGFALGSIAMVSSAHGVGPWRALDALGLAKILDLGRGVLVWYDPPFLGVAVVVAFAIGVTARAR